MSAVNKEGRMLHLFITLSVFKAIGSRWVSGIHSDGRVPGGKSIANLLHSKLISGPLDQGLPVH